MKRLVLIAVIAAGFLAAPTAHAHQIERQIECVGVMESRPVHIGDADNPYLKYGHGNLVLPEDAEIKQSKDCDTWFDGKNWKKVKDACQDDELCRVVGVIRSDGDWKHVIKAENVPAQSLPKEMTGEWCSVVSKNTSDKYERRSCRESDGRMTLGTLHVSYWESACDFTEVQKINHNSYYVRGDCGGEGMTWNATMVFQLTSDDHIQVFVITRFNEKSDSSECNGEECVDGHIIQQPEDKSELMRRWFEQNVACRGGSGDDDATDNACDLRTTISKKLKAQGCSFEHDDWKCKP